LNSRRSLFKLDWITDLIVRLRCLGVFAVLVMGRERGNRRQRRGAEPRRFDQTFLTSRWGSCLIGFAYLQLDPSTPLDPDRGAAWWIHCCQLAGMSIEACDAVVARGVGSAGAVQTAVTAVRRNRRRHPQMPSRSFPKLSGFQRIFGKVWKTHSPSPLFAFYALLNVAAGDKRQTQ